MNSNFLLFWCLTTAAMIGAVFSELSASHVCHEKIEAGSAIVRFKNLAKYIERVLANKEKADQIVKLIHEPTGKEICFGSWQSCAQAVEKLTEGYHPEDAILETTYVKQISCYSDDQEEQGLLPNKTSLP